jgi:hypothetical protein
MEIKIETVATRKDEVVLGSNPEMADMGNPEGHYYGEARFVLATNAAGNRWVHEKEWDTDDNEACEAFAIRVLAKGVINLDHWVETYEEYGSAAWAAADADRQYAHDSSDMAGYVRDY